jgi:hypothetical protein
VNKKLFLSIIVLSFLLIQLDSKANPARQIVQGARVTEVDSVKIRRNVRRVVFKNTGIEKIEDYHVAKSIRILEFVQNPELSSINGMTLNDNLTHIPQ